MSKAKEPHDGGHALYHEAVRRAQQPQEVRRHTGRRALLLTAPNNIIFELFDTVLSHVPSDQIQEYIGAQMRQFLDKSWHDKTIQRAVGRLRREAIVDERAGVAGAMPRIGRLSNSEHEVAAEGAKSLNMASSGSHNTPTIVVNASSLAQRPTSPTGSASSRSPTSPGQSHGHRHKHGHGHHSHSQKTHKSHHEGHASVKQVWEHVMWRIRANQVNQITSLLIKLALEDGYRTGRLKARAFAEVAECFEEWRARLLIKLYAFGDAPANDQRLVLASTTAGDLTKWVANYIDGSDKKLDPSIVAKLAGALRDKTRNCVYLTHDLEDALAALGTGALRLALVVDRDAHLEPLERLPNFEATLKPLMVSGKLFVVGALDCVHFAPDPTAANCC